VTALIALGCAGLFALGWYARDIWDHVKEDLRE
jgi:hypothetical protein